MKELHFICGLPRSGSTLLTSLLNQNPEFYASLTSPVNILVRWMRNAIHHNPDFNHIENDALREHFIGGVQGMVEGWYNRPEQIVFDKCRDWPYLRNIVDSAFPDAKYIFCIRDLRACVGSFLALNDKYPQYCHPNDIQEQNIKSNAIMHIEDAAASPLARSLQHLKNQLIDEPTMAGKVHFVRYEDLAMNPGQEMKKIYRFLGKEAFEHSFDEIEQDEREHDTIWCGWGNHKVSPKITPPTKSWKKYINDELAREILKSQKWFYEKYYNDNILENVQ